VSFTCPACGMTSHHPVYEREGYCGRCHQWTRQFAALEGTVFGFAPRLTRWLQEMDVVLVTAPVGWVCLHCGEPVAEGDTGFFRQWLLRNDGGGWACRIRAVHAQCEALGIVGHTHGVCTCTGFDTTSKTAADELWRRLGHRIPDVEETPHRSTC
jgi:hypothetical protein